MNPEVRVYSVGWKNVRDKKLWKCSRVNLGIRNLGTIYLEQ